jgi:hemin uptake protein HemP
MWSVPQDADEARVGRQPGLGPSGAEPPAVTSEALLRGGRELVIRHGAEVYRLRLTGNNKLILTK